MIDDNIAVVSLCGVGDEHLQVLENELDVKIVARGNEFKISGEADHVIRAEQALEELAGVAKTCGTVSKQQVLYTAGLAKKGENAYLQEMSKTVIEVTARGKQIVPKTKGQFKYVQAISDNGIVFAIGPAGTGKTYLAVAMAVGALRSRRVNRLILTRPAVEAGESLGFLPGDLTNKVDPYLRPLHDALYDILGQEAYRRYVERGMIEVAPLAYMRGRTLDDAFIILDEAQNTTSEQMKMFLTRLGFGSQAVITGDITQIDLPRGKRSGLVQIQSILRGIEGISFIYLDKEDIVRHQLVQRIIQAYEQYEENQGAQDEIQA
ncbi:MAG: PhoH family protein [Limnochordia bacterium]|jgi:phosphate starvation-inducible PhoH-like protein|nr:PhoH family protein [Limnochordia bacterium]MDD2628721.1 PhoH family protein [Limnochordia bacterium]MDD4517163.1 PhoH family protein [Limnochordia bacterium]